MMKIRALFILQLLSLLFACKPVEENLEYEVQSWYKYRDDGKPGRGVILYFKDFQIEDNVDVLVRWNGKKERKEFRLEEPTDSLTILMPEGLGVNEDCTVKTWVANKEHLWSGTLEIPAHLLERLRQLSHFIFGFDVNLERQIAAAKLFCDPAEMQDGLYKHMSEERKQQAPADDNCQQGNDGNNQA